LTAVALRGAARRAPAAGSVLTCAAHHALARAEPHLAASSPLFAASHALAGTHPLARSDSLARAAIEERARPSERALRGAHPDRPRRAEGGPFARAEPHPLRAAEAPYLAGSALEQPELLRASERLLAALEARDDFALDNVLPPLDERRRRPHPAHRP